MASAADVVAPDAGGRRRLIVTAAFVVLLLAQGIAHFLSTSNGRPYEEWDEVMTFNTSYGADQDLRYYRYGSLDSFMQQIAIGWHVIFDPVGQRFPHIRYANNVPESWSDPYLAFREKSWPQNVVDFNFFRGADDKEPIFLSRKIHLAFAYLTLLTLGLLRARRQGRLCARADASADSWPRTISSAHAVAAERHQRHSRIWLRAFCDAVLY